MAALTLCWWIPKRPDEITEKGPERRSSAHCNRYGIPGREVGIIELVDFSSIEVRSRDRSEYGSTQHIGRFVARSSGVDREMPQAIGVFRLLGLGHHQRGVIRSEDRSDTLRIAHERRCG